VVRTTKSETSAPPGSCATSTTFCLGPLYFFAQNPLIWNYNLSVQNLKIIPLNPPKSLSVYTESQRDSLSLNTLRFKFQSFIVILHILKTSGSNKSKNKKW